MMCEAVRQARHLQRRPLTQRLIAAQRPHQTSAAVAGSEAAVPGEAAEGQAAAAVWAVPEAGFPCKSRRCCSRWPWLVRLILEHPAHAGRFMLGAALGSASCHRCTHAAT